MADSVDRYYAEIGVADDLWRQGKTAAALKAALINLRRVPALVQSAVTEYGRFDLTSVPPIETGCRIAAVLGDEAALEEISSLVNSRQELVPWREVVDQGYVDLTSARLIRRHIEANPGTIQSTLGKALGMDGRYASELAYQLTVAHFVSRERQGRSYALYQVGAKISVDSARPAAPKVAEARAGRDALAVEAAARLGTGMEALEAARAKLGPGFGLGDAYWRIANQQVLEAAAQGNWTRAVYLYRQMASYVAAEGKPFAYLLRCAIWCELWGAAQGSWVPGESLSVVGCTCSGCLIEPRSFAFDSLAALGASPRDLPATFPLPHEDCQAGPCPCRLEAAHRG